MHWLDGTCDGAAGNYAHLIGVEVLASSADPPSLHDRFGRRHRNPPLCVR